MQGMKSVLAEAFEALQRGDAAQGRSLARLVLAGKKGPDEQRAADLLALDLSLDDARIEATPEAVARELLDRSQTPGKAYAFALIAAAIFLLLLTLATTRYAV